MHEASLPGQAVVRYPAQYPDVLAVGGLSSDGMKSARSDFGKDVDIMAPSEHLYTTCA